MSPLDVSRPDGPLDAILDYEKTAAWVETLIIAAEREIQGVSRGRERLAAVVEVVLETVTISVTPRDAGARILVLAVYAPIAKQLPDRLRASRQETS